MIARVAVEHRTYPGAGHDGVMVASAGDATRWLAERLAGDDPLSSCGDV